MRRTPLTSLLSRNPVFRNFITASTISLLGSSIFDISMPLYVWERTHSAIALSFVTVGLHLPYFLMAPVTGYSVDQFDKRRVMLFTDIGQVLTMLFLVGYVFSEASALWPIIVAVFVAKTLMITFETVTTFQLIPGLVPPEDLSQANTWFLSSLRLIQVFGPATGGMLMSFFGVRSCILVNIVSFGATLFFVYKMKNLSALIDGDEAGDFKRDKLSLRNMMRNFTDSLRYIRASKIFRPFIPLMFLWNLSSLIPNTPTVTYYFTATRHFTSAQYGSIVSLFGIFGIIGYLIASKLYDRVDFYKTFVGACLWQAVLGTVAVAFMPYPLALAVLFGISRTGSSILNMGTFLIRQTRVPKRKMGGINACLRMCFMSAAPLSALFQGYLLEHVGVGLPLALGTLCLWGVVWYGRDVANAYESKGLKPDLTGKVQAA